MAWSITYRDGCANTYRFAENAAGATFDYDPVRPEQSSTGQYSGGDPRSGRIKATVADDLWRQVRTFETETVLHVGDRMKGTGAFEVTDAAGTRAFLIAHGPALASFDAFVAALK